MTPKTSALKFRATALATMIGATGFGLATTHQSTVSADHFQVLFR